jgi:hypothetical protein
LLNLTALIIIPTYCPIPQVKNVTSYWLDETLGNDSLIDTYFLIFLAFLCGAVEVSVILE